MYQRFVADVQVVNTERLLNTNLDGKPFCARVRHHSVRGGRGQQRSADRQEGQQKRL